MSCTHTSRAVDAVERQGPLDDDLARHVEGCDDCARALTQAQLDARGLLPATEGDGAVFAALGLGSWPAGIEPGDRDFLGELVHGPAGALPGAPAGVVGPEPDGPTAGVDRPSALSRPMAMIPADEMVDLPLPPPPVSALHIPPPTRRRRWGAWLAAGGALAAGLLALIVIDRVTPTDDPLPSMAASEAPAEAPAKLAVGGPEKAAEEKAAAEGAPDAMIAAADAGPGADDGEDEKKVAAASPEAPRRATRRTRRPSASKPAEPKPAARKPAARKPAAKKESASEVDDLLGALDGSGGGSKSRAASPAAAPAAAADPLLPEKLTRRQILTVIKANARSITTCKAGTDASGTVPVEIVIGRAGRVTSAQVKSGPQKGTAVGECIERKVRAFRFPQFSGDPMRIVMPFAL